MSTLEEIKGSLTTIGTEIDKISGETTALLAKIEELKANPPADPAQAALIDEIASMAQGIAAKVKAVDDLVPDA